MYQFLNPKQIQNHQKSIRPFFPSFSAFFSFCIEEAKLESNPVLIGEDVEASTLKQIFTERTGKSSALESATLLTTSPPPPQHHGHGPAPFSPPSKTVLKAKKFILLNRMTRHRFFCFGFVHR